MILGIYYMTKMRKGVKGEGRVFSGADEVRIAYDADVVSEHALIKVRMNGEMTDTSPGRILLGEVLPVGIPFSMINKEMTKKEVGNL